jgi:hypothetical protein
MGMTPRARLSLFERLVHSRTDSPLVPDDECWIWTGARDAKGYGFVKVDGKTRRVYRVAWELATGRKLGERTAEHTCRNPSCWRPSHIVPLSRAANTAKGNRDNPRSTEKARRVRAEMRATLAGLAAVQDAAARIMAEGRAETVTPVTPRPEAGG